MKSYVPYVSVIVPVYNAEKTLCTTLSALLIQTYTQLELIFVNDYSRDGSLIILQDSKSDFEHRKINVKILNHDVNRGVAAARNTGLSNATGKYIYYVDADDAIEPDTVELLVKTAEQQQADIVGCNWFLTFNKNERKMNQPSFANPWQAIENILNGVMRWNLWLFMVKRSLYEDNYIRFTPKQNMGEDLMVMVKLFFYANKVTYVDKALYHYGQSNEQSLTKTYSDRHIAEVTANVKEVEDFLSDKLDKQKLTVWMSYLKLNIKLPLLISDNGENHNLWNRWFVEANRYALHNRSVPWRIRILQYAASKRLYFLVKCHYYLVVRVVYGLIYR